jgi:superfamily II DNA helicase RecQ
MPYVQEIDPPIPGYICSVPNCDGCDAKGAGPQISPSLDLATRRRGGAHKGFTGEEGLQKVYLQRFGPPNIERPYFVVEYNPESQAMPLGEASNSAIRYIRQHLDRYDQDRARQLKTVNAPLDSSTNSRWLIRTGIDKHLEGHDTARLRSSLDLQHTIKGKDGTLSNICTSIKSLLQEAFRLTTTNNPGSKLSETTSALLNKFDPTSPQKLFHPLERGGSKDKYIKSVQQLVSYCYVEGYSSKEHPSRIGNQKAPFTLSASQKEAFRKCENLNRQHGKPEQWKGMALELLMTLIAHPIPTYPYESGMVSFFAARSSTASGYLQNPNVTTPILSALVKCGQLVLFMEALRRAGGNMGDIKAEVEELCAKWLMNDQDAPLAQLSRWRGIGMDIAKSHVPMPQVHWSVDGDVVTSDRQKLSLKRLRCGIQSSILLVSSKLNKELLLGIENLPLLDISALDDVLAEPAAGYSFLRDPRNPLYSYRNSLSDSICQQPELRNQFFGRPECQPHLNTVQAKQYLKAVNDFLREIMCLAHITYGLPARGPELMSSRVENGLIHRNLYVINGRLCIATYHGKRNWSNGETPVLRYIHPSLADLLVKYLTFVRPFVNLLEVIIHSLSKPAATIVEDTSEPAPPPPSLPDFEEPIDDQSDCGRVEDTLHNTDADLINENNDDRQPNDDTGAADEANDHDPDWDQELNDEGGAPAITNDPTGTPRSETDTYEFLDQAFLFRSAAIGRWGPEQLSGVLQWWFKEYADAKGIGLRTWRQMATAIERKYGDGIGDTARLMFGLVSPVAVEDPNCDPIAHWQAGRSVATGNIHYGNDANVGRGLTDSLLHRYRSKSIEWYRILELDKACDPHPLRPSTTSSSIANSLKRKAETPLQPIPSPVSPSSKRIRTTPIRQPVALPDLGLQLPPTMDDVFAALTRLRGPECALRQNGQFEAMEAIVSGCKNIFVILPPGAGKTLLYLLTSLLPSRRVNIVVAPQVVLKTQVLNECRECGVGITVWNQRRPENLPLSSLVLVGVEDATSVQFGSLVNGLDVCGRLGTVFLDEVHLTYTAQDYRPDFFHLREFRWTSAQIVCLSATLAPAALPEVCARLEMLPRPVSRRLPGIRVVRRSVDRPELQYLVKIVQPLARLTGVDMSILYNDIKAATECIHLADTSTPKPDRFLCFIQSKTTCDEVAAKLKTMGVAAVSFHSDIGVEERVHMISDWKLGKTLVLVGTSCIGSALDYPAVSRIWWWSATGDSAHDMMQELGRGARDFPFCRCTIFLPHTYRQHLGQSPSYQPTSFTEQPNDFEQARQHLVPVLEADKRALNEFLLGKECRRKIMTQYLDGRSVLCSQEETLCDNCADLASHKSPPDNESIASYISTNTLSDTMLPDPGVTCSPWDYPLMDAAALFAMSSTDQEALIGDPSTPRPTFAASPFPAVPRSLYNTVSSASSSSVLPHSSQISTQFSNSIAFSTPATKTSSLQSTLAKAPRATVLNNSDWRSRASLSFIPASSALLNMQSGTQESPYGAISSSDVPSSFVVPQTPLGNGSLSIKRGAYRALLSRWRDCCFFCTAVGREGTIVRHDRDNCPLAATQRCLYKTFRRQIKFDNGVGCWFCSLPEWACVYQRGVRRAHYRCEFKDQVLELCYNRWHQDQEWREASHTEITIVKLLSEDDLVNWLQGSCTSWLGSKTSNAAVAAFSLLSQLRQSLH